MNEQVTPQVLVLGAAGCLRATLAPSPYTAAVAPGFYRFFLRRIDYEMLQPLFSAIAGDAARALDHELQQMNQEAGTTGWLGQLFGGNKAHKAYLKPYTGWSFYFDVDDNLDEAQPYRIEASPEALADSIAHDVGPDVLPEVAAPEAAAEAHEAVAGASEATVEIELPPTLPSPTVESEEAVASTESPADSMPAPHPAEQLATTLPSEVVVKPLAAEHSSGGSKTGAGRVYAEISFTDERGPQVYFMKKAQIVVGRGGREYWVDLKLQTAADVSHEHLRIRYDERAGQFQVKDLSTFGTTINGVRIESSMENQNGVRRDVNLWVELPADARVGLADVLFLEFKALSE